MIFIDRNSPFMVRAVPEGLLIKTKGYFISGASLPKNDYKHVSSSLTVSEIYFDKDAILKSSKTLICFLESSEVIF